MKHQCRGEKYANVEIEVIGPTGKSHGLFRPKMVMLWTTARAMGLSGSTAEVYTQLREQLISYVAEILNATPERVHASIDRLIGLEILVPNQDLDPAEVERILTEEI